MIHSAKVRIFEALAKLTFSYLYQNYENGTNLILSNYGSTVPARIPYK